MTPTASVNSSPSKASRLSSSSINSAKRPSSPPSPSSSSRSSKVQKVEKIEVDSFDEDFGFDQDALLEATLIAEEEAASTSTKQNSSQVSQAASSSSLSSANTKQYTPKKAETVAAVDESASSTKTPTPSLSSSKLTHGDTKLEEETMDPEWYSKLKEEMQKQTFVNLKNFLKKETEARKVIYPPAHLVHSWSRLTPLSTVKVVILGQDPYHGPNQACGHSFSVPKGVNTPGSLLNMYKELSTEYGAAFKRPSHGCLDGWAKQGVLLLNACLTVEQHKAGSHHKQGWEPFTQAVLRAVADDASHGATSSIKSSTIASMFSKVDSSVKKQVEESKDKSKSGNTSSSSSKGVVFLAWGLPASKSLKEAGITKSTPNVLILESAHPSPLSAHRGFLGNGHFKKANDWLEADSRYGKNGGISWGSL